MAIRHDTLARRHPCRSPRRRFHGQKRAFTLRNPTDTPRSRTATESTDNLTDFYLLARVIESGGFSAAAQQTGISKSRLSRRIIELEQRLGSQLLLRSTRTLTVTPVGEEVYRHVQDMLQAVRAAESCIQQFLEEPCGLIRICTPPLLEELLAEALAQFAMLHPKVRIILDKGDGLRALLGQRVDLAFNLGSAPSDSIEVVPHPLAHLRLVCVGSPALLEQLGHPRQPAQIDKSRFLSLGPAHAPQPWQLRGTLEIQPNPSYVSDSLTALRSAARAGLGLAQLPLHACADDLRRGLLQLALESFEPQPCAIQALTPPSRMVTPAVRALIQFLRQQLGRDRERGILEQAPAKNEQPA